MTETEVQLTVSRRTDAPDVKPVPLRVIVVPPRWTPEVGRTVTTATAMGDELGLGLGLESADEV